MLTETQSLNHAAEALLSKDQEATSRQSSFGRYLTELIPFCAVVLQFGLIVLIVTDWQLENRMLSQVIQLAFVGFIIHHLLPVRCRLPFFGLLSVVAVIFGVGETGVRKVVSGLTGRIPVGEFLYPLSGGLIIVVIGLGLIGLCHLPVRFRVRVLLIALAGVCLAVLRAQSHWFPDVKGIWVVLGSMFMFRLMLYLYDLRHRAAPFSPARAISYFFLLPNVCFPLFPVVDYKTFCSTYYNEDWRRVYQTGLNWMFRGIVQLLLYRVIYQYAPLDVYQVSSALDAFGCMLGLYLLYLRISGTFHLIVGLLHMFGFNLPETHHLYLLSTSFTDFWRRINIYWKDFVMKLFFYPVHFRLRRMGMLRAMSVATVVTFLATWVLHSWQWFWIRGKPLLTWKDFSFWMILAVLVLVTALHETARGRKRVLTPSRVTLAQRSILGLQAGGMFCLMCILWSYWSCETWEEFGTLIAAAARPSVREVMIVLGTVLVICIWAMLRGSSSRETSEGRSAHSVRPPFHFWRSTGMVTAGAVCLLVVPSFASRVLPNVNSVLLRLHGDVLNARDLALQRRGYYEELDVGRMDNWQWQYKGKVPEGWHEGRNVLYRQRSDFLLTEMVPSVSTIMGGAPIKSNRMGLRDREYSEIKPANTYRIVLFGGSHDMGTGVKDYETYENLVEDRLNSNTPVKCYSHYEILNLSIGGSSILQRVLWLEQKGFPFAPDAALLSIAAYDQQFLIEHLRKIVARGIDPPSDYHQIVEEVIGKARVHRKMPDAMIEARLKPYVSEIYEWAFHRFAAECRRRNIHPVIIYRPAPVDFEGLEAATRREIIRLAGAARFELIDLSRAFDTVVNRDQLIVAKWDHHTNELGHRLLAEKMYEGLLPLLRAESAAVSAVDTRATTADSP